MTMKLSKFILLLVFLPLCIFADDRQKAKTVREAVWAWDKPEFKNYELPAGYENESAIILVRHQHLEATSKNRFRINAMLFGDINRELFYTNISRSMVKINDLSALNEFAELSFKDEIKTSGYLRSNKFKTIVGARVIKPNGEIVEVAVDDEAVATTEGKKEKDALKKLTISGLQVGDILDYFICDEMELETYNIPPQEFIFYAKYPVLNYSIHCEFGDKLTVEYRSINGAPKMKLTTDTDNNYILDAEAKNLMTLSAYDNTRWISPYRTLPVIRMYVLNNSSKLIYKSPNARKSGVFENLPYEDYLNDSKALLAAQEKQMFWMGDIEKKVKKTVLAYTSNHPSMSDEQMAVLLYDALRFYWPNNYSDFPQSKFTVKLQKLFKEYNVKHKLLFATNRFGARKAEVVSTDDITPGLLANDKQLFFFYNGYRYADEISSIFEGETASTVELVKYAGNKKYGIEGNMGQYEIPISKVDDNRLAAKIEVKLSNNNPQELTIKRNLKCSGNIKEDYWSLALFEDWDKEMRKGLGIEQTFIEELQEDKSTRKRIDEYTSSLETRKKNQKENVKAELTAYHGQEPKNITDYCFDGIGTTLNNPTLDYTVSYALDGLVKKAGSNFIFDIGKLIGQQWQPDELDQKRNIDAYLPTAMCLNYELEIKIPEGYTVEGLAALSFTYSTDYASFNSTYKLDGNTLFVSVNKIYKNAYIPLNKWNDVLSVAQKTNDFQAKTIILRKQ